MKRLIPVLILMVLAGCSTQPPAPAFGPAPPTESGPPAADRTTTAARLIADVPASSPDTDRLAWSPDGLKLAYTGPERRISLLDLTSPESPRQLTADWSDYPIFTADGEAVAYVCAGSPRQGGTGEWRPATLCLQEPGSGEAVDLLPGDLAVRSVSTAKKPLRWLDGDSLVYWESMGTSVKRVFVLNVNSGELTEEPNLSATLFWWSPDGGRVAGQWLGGPPLGFWVWDRQAGYLRQPSTTWEVFEAWSPDGRELLYSEWSCDTPYCPQGHSTLWRLDLATGQRERVAEDAGLAAWSASGQIAYVQLGGDLELAVADAGTGLPLWAEKLGPRPEGLEQSNWDLYRPRFEGGYLAFRNAQGDWFVSRAETKDVHHIYRGVTPALVWGPDGRHLAILDDGRLLVLENRL